MKIEKLLAPKQEEIVTESDAGTSTAGSVASVNMPLGRVQRRGKGSMLQGIKTSAKFPNSVAVKEGAYEDGVNDGIRGQANPRASSIYGPESGEYSRGYKDGLVKGKEQQQQNVANYQAELAPYKDIETDELKQMLRDIRKRSDETQAIFDKYRGASRFGGDVPPNVEELKKQGAIDNKAWQAIHQELFQRGVPNDQRMEEGEEQLDEIFNPTSNLAHFLRAASSFAGDYIPVAIGAAGTFAATTAVLGPVAAMMASSTVGTQILQTMQNQQNKVPSLVQQLVEKYFGSEQEEVEFAVLHAKAAFLGQTEFRWRGKQWPVTLEKNAAEAIVEKNDKYWLEQQNQSQQPAMAEGISRAVDKQGRTQQEWIQAVYKAYPDAKIVQAKMIDGPCYAMLADGRKVNWVKDHDLDEARKASANTKTARQALSKRPRKDTLSDREKEQKKSDSDKLWDMLQAHIAQAEQEKKVDEASPETTFNVLKGLKTYQVVIFNNYYAGKYSDYRGRYYYVLATSPEEAKQVVIDNADGILQELLAMKSQNGKKILPRGTAVRITPERIGKIEDGTVAGRMSTAGFKKMFGPQGPMMVKLSGGAVVDMQGQEVDEADPGYNKHSFIGKIRRGREADNKGWGQLGQLFAAGKDEKAAEKALRKGNRYYNMVRGNNKTPGGFPKTTIEGQGVAEEAGSNGFRVTWTEAGQKCTSGLLLKPHAIEHAKMLQKKSGTSDVKIVPYRQVNEKSKSQAQFRTMAAVAHNPKFAKKVGISQKVGKEFHSADKGANYKSLPKKVDEDSHSPEEFQDIVDRANGDVRGIYKELQERGLHSEIKEFCIWAKHQGIADIFEAIKLAEKVGLEVDDENEIAYEGYLRASELLGLREIDEGMSKDEADRIQALYDKLEWMEERYGWDDPRVKALKDKIRGVADEYSVIGQNTADSLRGVSEEKQRLDPKCWKGYKKQGTKMKGDTRVNNCVKVDEADVSEDKLASDLYRDLQIFKKGTDKGISSKAKDKEIGNKPADKDIVAKEGFDDFVKGVKRVVKGKTDPTMASAHRSNEYIKSLGTGDKETIRKAERNLDRVNKVTHGKMSEQGVEEGFGDTIKKKAKQFSKYMTEPNSPHNALVRSRAKNIAKIRKKESEKSVFEKDPEAMREFERSGGYKAGLDIMGWQVGWAAASHARGQTMKDAFQKLYYGGGSPFPFDIKSFRLAWVAYNKHYGPQGNLEEMDGDGAGRDGSNRKSLSTYGSRDKHNIPDGPDIHLGSDSVMTKKDIQDRALNTLTHLLSKPENINVLKRLKNK